MTISFTKPTSGIRTGLEDVIEDLVEAVNNGGGGGGGAVASVNGQTGTVVLTASSVGAQPADADLTAIAASGTTAYGRSLLTTADSDAAKTAFLPSGGLDGQVIQKSGNTTVWGDTANLLTSGLGGELPWAAPTVLSSELWRLEGFTNNGSNPNLVTLSPSIVANGVARTVDTTVGLSNTGPGDVSFRFACTIASVPTNGWWYVGVAIVDNGSVIAGTNIQYIVSAGSTDPLGRFEFEFTAPVNVNRATLRLELNVSSNATSGTLAVSDCSLVEVSHASRHMLYGADGQPYPAVWCPLFDPVSGVWKMAYTSFGQEGQLGVSWNVMTGYSRDRVFTKGLPDPTFLAPTLSYTDDIGMPGITLASATRDFLRPLRYFNNDQIIGVENDVGAHELLGNVHTGETNNPAATFKVDLGDGTWRPWSTPLVKHLRPCRRLKLTYPTEFRRASEATPFATVDHELTVFNDGVQRMDRTTKFVKDVRLGLMFEWMATFDQLTPKVGRLGRGLFVLNEVDTHNLLLSPASPAATASGTGGTLPAATYGYVVTTLSEMGESTPTNMVTATTTGTTSKVTVGWSAVANATGYRVYGRSSVVSQGRGQLGLLATVGPGVTSYDDDYSAVPTPGVFPPDLNTARRDTGAGNSWDMTSHGGANWAAWYDLKLNMVFANLYDRDAVLARPGVKGVKTRIEAAPGITKNYLNVYWVGDGEIRETINCRAVASGTEWTATHWTMVYCPADRENWHMEAAIRSMDLATLKTLYPST